MVVAKGRVLAGRVVEPDDALLDDADVGGGQRRGRVEVLGKP